MSSINKEEIKRIVTAIKSGKLSGARNQSRLNRQPISNKRQAAGEMIEAVLQKSGLNLERVNKLAAAEQQLRQRAFEKELATAAKRSKKANAAFRSAMAERFVALKDLGLPHVSTFDNLDKPFLIAEVPIGNSDVLNASNIESMNSSMDVFVNKAVGSQGTHLNFFFLWVNPSDLASVVNVRSSLIVNGACSVQAHSGIISGHRSGLDIVASLIIQRWSKWGNDPITGDSNNQTPHPDFQDTQIQPITFLEAQGGHIFQEAAFKSQSFSFQQVPLSHRLLLVPPSAVTIFEVSIQLVYELRPGGNIEDNVFVDFSNNGNGIFCPNVEVEILAPLTSVITS